MHDPEHLLADLEGTRFGPVEFGALRDGVLSAGVSGASVRVFVDGPTLVAVGDAAASAQPGDWPAALVQIDLESGGRQVRVWATACTAGEVAQAAFIAAQASPRLFSGAPERDRAAGAAVEVGAAGVAGAAPSPAPEGLSKQLEEGIGLLALSCSDDIARPVRELLLGERSQVLLSRPQLDQLTGAVLGDVMVFGVGAGGRGGVSLHAVLPSGRAADVEVRVDEQGIHIDPAWEGTEVRAALDHVNEVLAARGLRLARMVGTGDHVVLATEPAR